MTPRRKTNRLLGVGRVYVTCAKINTGEQTQPHNISITSQIHRRVRTLPRTHSRPSRHHRMRRIYQNIAHSQGVPQGQSTRSMMRSHLCTQRLRDVKVEVVSTKSSPALFNVKDVEETGARVWTGQRRVVGKCALFPILLIPQHSEHTMYPSYATLFFLRDHIKSEARSFTLS